MSGNHFLETHLILASGDSFSRKWKPFSSIASDIFQEVLHSARGNRVEKRKREEKKKKKGEEKELFFPQNFFSC